MRISDWSSDVCSSDLGSSTLRHAQGERVIQITSSLLNRHAKTPAGERGITPGKEREEPKELRAGVMCARAGARRVRSEERRVGKEVVRTGRSRRSPYHEKQNWNATR